MRACGWRRSTRPVLSRYGTVMTTTRLKFNRVHSESGLHMHSSRVSVHGSIRLRLALNQQHVRRAYTSSARTRPRTTHNCERTCWLNCPASSRYGLTRSRRCWHQQWTWLPTQSTCTHMDHSDSGCSQQVGSAAQLTMERLHRAWLYRHCHPQLRLLHYNAMQ